MLKIAICDDVREDIDRLAEMLYKTGLFKKAEYCLFESGESLLRAVENGNIFDIVLLDINMPGMNGIDAGKRLTELIPYTILIYVTNYPEYAIQAFDTNAYHYVLKSESDEKFFEVLSKAKVRYLKRKKSHLVRTKGGATHLLLDEIKYVEYCDKHLRYRTANGTYSERGQIGELAEELEEFGFIYVHQGYLVNSKWIRAIKKDTVELTDGTELMMSMKRRSRVIERYNLLNKA